MEVPIVKLCTGDSPFEVQNTLNAYRSTTLHTEALSQSYSALQLACWWFKMVSMLTEVFFLSHFMHMTKYLSNLTTAQFLSLTAVGVPFRSSYALHVAPFSHENGLNAYASPVLVTLSTAYNPFSLINSINA